MTEFKICGLRTLDHALAAADTGASFLGFVFVPGVRRQIEEAQAAEIIQEVKKRTGADGPRSVGLCAFVCLVRRTVRGLCHCACARISDPTTAETDECGQCDVRARRGNAARSELCV